MEEDNLPNGWAVARVQDLFSIVGGGTPSTVVPEYWQGNVPWITSADIDDQHKITPRRSISEEAIENSATNLVPPGSVIVVTRVGLGKVGIAETRLCFSQDSQALIFPQDLLDSRYVLFYMGTAVAVFKHISRGTTISGVTKKQLANLEFRLPPVPEQGRIVAEIERQFTRLEAGVVALKRVQANLKRYRAAVLKAAVEGRLVPTEAELARREGRTYEPADALIAKVKVPEVKRGRTRAGRLWGAGVVPQLTKEEKGKLPGGWTWVKVRDLGPVPDEVVQVGPMSMRSRDFVDSGVPVFNVGCIGWAEFDETKLNFLRQDVARHFQRYSIRPGDILFTRSGTVGRSAVARKHHGGWLMTFHLLRVRTDPAWCSPEYLRIVFEGASHIRRQTRQASMGTTRAGFNTNLLAGLDVPLPPVEEQERILAEVERRLSLTDEVEMQVEANLRRAERLRQAVLKRAFEGKLVPQDPNDEPASVLLERIKAAKCTGKSACATGAKATGKRSM